LRQALLFGDSGQCLFDAFNWSRLHTPSPGFRSSIDEGTREVREMDLRRLLASALLSSPSRTASLTDCRAMSILCVAKRTSMMRFTVVTGSPTCSPISWRDRLSLWIATHSGHFRRSLADVGTVRFTRNGFASEIP
jgi:hypothetical protein